MRATARSAGSSRPRRRGARTASRGKRGKKMQSVSERAAGVLSPETITRRVLDSGPPVIVFPNPTTPALVGREQAAGAMPERAFRETLYPEGHPYHLRTSGFLETLDNIRREDMVTFYKRYFRPERSTMVVVGDVEPEEIVGKVAGQLG